MNFDHLIKHVRSAHAPRDSPPEPGDGGDGAAGPAMPPGTPYDDDDDRRRRDSRDTSLGEKFADLASAIKDRTGEALEDMTDKLKKTKESWEESDRQRDRRYDDDDDRPVFRGNRNYEGVGVGVGEALGDMATAGKRTTDRVI